MGSFSIVDDIFEFITELVKSLKDGYLFFGSKWDLIRYAADIAGVSTTGNIICDFPFRLYEKDKIFNN